MKKTFAISSAICALCWGLALSVAQNPQDEYAELMKILKEPSIDMRLKSGEEFLQKFPKSEYVPNVRSQLVYDYNQKGNTTKVIEHGETATGEDGVLLTFLANAYSDKKNDGKTVETGQKAVEVLNKAAKPANVTDAQWAPQKNTMLSVNQYLIGAAFANQAQRKTGDEKASLLAASRQALMAALKLNPRYDVAYYQLGLTLSDMGEGVDACEALAKAVVIGGPTVKPFAQRDLDRIYLYYNKSRVGLDNLLAKVKASMK